MDLCEGNDSEEKPVSKAWATGDAISDRDRENIRNLIYAGFSRRRTATKLGLHKDLVGEVFDEYAPRKTPVLSDEVRARIKKVIASGSSLPELAAEFGVSPSTARVYAQAVGVHPRTLTPKYLREKREKP